MIYKTVPKNFNPKFEVVSCYVECDGKILLLRRNKEKSQGDKWGVPAGKMEVGESLEVAMSREMSEETGLEIKSGELIYLEKVFVRYPNYDFVYHMFRAELDYLPKIVVNPKEHQRFFWATIREALAMRLVDDLGGCIKLQIKI